MRFDKQKAKEVIMAIILPIVIGILVGAGITLIVIGLGI